MTLYFYRENIKGEEFCKILNSENNNEKFWICEINLFANLKIYFDKIIISGIYNDTNNILNNSKYIFDIELLKSNLQKAVRKQLTDIALSTAYTMILQNKTQLLRRLPIIALEDSSINFQDLTFLIWLMIADSKGYKLTNYDINKILSIVENITNNKYRDYLDNDSDNLNYLINSNLEYNYDQDFVNYYNSIFIRLEFGTMEGDKKWLINMANEWLKRINKKDGNISYYLKKIPKAEVKEYNFKELEFKKKYQLSEAVDFHCYKNIFNELKEKIPEIKYESREDLTKAIWYLRSSINVREKFIRHNKKAEEFCEKYKNERIKYSNIFSVIEKQLNLISDDYWNNSIKKKKNNLLNFI